MAETLNSSTPRTDAATLRFTTGAGGMSEEFVRADFAQVLERELTECRVSHDKLAVDYEKLQYRYQELDGSISDVKAALDECDLLPSGSLADRVRALTHHHREWKEMFTLSCDKRAEVEAYAEALREALEGVQDALANGLKFDGAKWLLFESGRDSLLGRIGAALAQGCHEIGQRNATDESVGAALDRAVEAVRPIVERERESGYPTPETMDMTFKAVQVRYSEILTAAREAGKQPYNPALNPLFDAIYGAEPIFAAAANPVHAVGHSERDLLRIIVSGPHCIDDDTAAFYRDPGKPSNALHQLVHRVSGFLSQYSAPADCSCPDQGCHPSNMAGKVCRRTAQLCPAQCHPQEPKA